MMNFQPFSGAFPGIAANAKNYNNRTFDKTYQILKQTKRNINKCL